MKAVVLFGLILFIELDLWKTIFWNSSNLWTITSDLSPLLTHFLWTILYHISFPCFFIFIFSLIFLLFLLLSRHHTKYIIIKQSSCLIIFPDVFPTIYLLNIFNLYIIKISFRYLSCFHYLYIYSIHYHHSFASFRSLRLILIDILAPFNF